MAEQINKIKYDEEFITSSRGMKLFTCRWLPSTEPPKALIFLCHGYAMECSIYMKDIAFRLVEAGFGVHGIDYEGHGKSSGLQGFVSSFDDLVNDCSDHFMKICERQENKMMQRFLFGESMGGALLLRLHLKNPTFWNGAILVAPMCKIADEMRPHPLIVSILVKLSDLIPTWKIIPTKDIIDIAFKSPQIREEIRNNPYCYKGRPRLKTGAELLLASLDIEKRLHEVSLPFLIVHGGDDKVTDPAVSKLLYETARSSDKTFKLYPGMWHALISGEPPESIGRVFADIVTWLEERTISPEARQEMEWKAKHELERLILSSS